MVLTIKTMMIRKMLCQNIYKKNARFIGAKTIPKHLTFTLKQGLLREALWITAINT